MMKNIKCQVKSLIPNRLTRIIFLYSTSIFLFSVFGCQDGQQIGKITFPESLIGTWTDAESGWSFVFEPGGNISYVTRVDGQEMDIASGGGVHGNIDGEYYVHFMYGISIWEYDSILNEISVIITIDDFYVTAGDQELSCKIVDEFKGKLSEDKTTWSPLWTTTTIWHDEAPNWVSEGGRLLFKRRI